MSKSSLLKLMAAAAFFIFSQLSHAYLEVDETITLRLLRLSESKQTILINRGLEDGLVVDMHAKFFLPTGVVARGKVVKASPSRSIWSMYRIIEEEQLVEDRVLNAKISTPMMLTDDPGKRDIRVLDPTSSSRARTARARQRQGEISPVLVADGDADLSDEERAELEQFSTNRPVSWGGAARSSLNERDWEVWSLLHLNMLSGTFEDEATTGTTSQSNFAFSVGIEKYFPDLGSFFSPLTANLLLSIRTSESGESVSVSTSWLEYGLGLNYHFYGDHWSSDNLIGYGSLSLGVGSVTSGVSSQLSDDELIEATLDGSSSFFSVGAGVKYYLDNGFGMRALLDYYQIGENYSFEDGEVMTRTLSGPRVQLGLSYRF